MDTCDDAQRWTIPDCDDRATLRLTVQNLTFADGNASGEEDGGGAAGLRSARRPADLRRPQHLRRRGRPRQRRLERRSVEQPGVSWAVINSLLSYNRAIGEGGNPAQQGTPGGGSGDAIHNDGRAMTLRLCGSRLEHNQVNACGSAIFFVSNDHTGRILIYRSITANDSGGSWYPTHPQISNHADTPILATNTTIAETL